MFLSIYSLKKTLFEGEAASLNCQTEAGEITVLPHHTPLISVLKPGVITVVPKDSQELFLDSTGGFLEVTAQDRVTVTIEEK